MELLNHIISQTASFMETISKRDRKKYGQFFTSRSSAEYMASMFDIDYSKPSLKLLDAGAGSGILSTALVETLRNKGYQGTIELTCYETDSIILPLLSQNLQTLAREAGIQYTVKTDNYLTSQPFSASPRLFLSENEEQFDLVIGNPPYMKIPKDTPEAKNLHDVCYGAPNLYFLFWAMGIQNLVTDGELVYIIPRSWTSGAYFDRFRRYLLNNCSIMDIHLFGSRDKIFDGESVLQETIIVKVKKSTDHPKKIGISYSETSDMSNIHKYDVDYDVIVSKNGYVYLVTKPEEIEVLSKINRQDETLVSVNLPMKTGLIVDFRTQEVLRDNADEQGTYPLFYSSHIKDGKVVWPCGREKEYIHTSRKGYLQENGNYLFIKRFTSKEERRRLQCGVYIQSEHPDYPYISTQNKINYIRCQSPAEAYGLYVILNSTLYDVYYRILNGSTQVNSTEINNMPIPSKDVIVAMGKEIMNYDLGENSCNKILSQWIK